MIPAVALYATSGSTVLGARWTGAVYGALVASWLVLQTALAHAEYARQRRTPTCRHGSAISVVIPSFNADPPNVRGWVQRLLQQDYDGPIEAIVVDDGSSTPPPDLIASALWRVTASCCTIVSARTWASGTPRRGASNGRLAGGG